MHGFGWEGCYSNVHLDPNGNVFITVRDRVALNGRSTDGDFASSIVTKVEENAMGKGSNLEIFTNSLQLSNGAQLVSATFGIGDAGSISISARERVFVNSSGAFSRVESTGRGNSGNLQITTDNLEVANLSQLSASTLGVGNAGNVIITANRASIIDSDVLSRVGRTAMGKGGNVQITANVLEVVNGGSFIVNTLGIGDAGNIIINARDHVLFSGISADGNFPSGAFSEVFLSNARGNGGNIQIATKTLEVTNGAQVFAGTSSAGNAGNIVISANNILLTKSLLSAESASVDGGNITLNARDILLLRNRSLISATAGIAQQGGNGGNITINAPNGFVVSSPNENSDITANAFSGRGGNVDITAQGVFGIQFRPSLTPQSDITASSQFGISGAVEINTRDTDPSRGLITLSTVTENPPKLVSSSCTAFNETAGGNNFTITGRGGLPPSPYEPLTSDAIWSDTRRPLTTVHQNQPKKQAAKIKHKPIEIVPATGWVFNRKGEVTLISSVSNAPSTPTSCAAR
ncbi:S-layer family protein [Aetokthonos hydrillicola Thurmond2011]|jgi:large exoprotein involved in heme utilization and adhesion|uniref:S-layer family protein n=1 Tax=Aetokthonos hydrillicola Thurmond2011 TaxID=2712845 RepID=A0AAP5MCQ7_9CYAN|nr:S-layer family protein [Aetokthonos hydrillicola]MBO3459504.1 S-layer family protein [Aetokthonos hydrillicola CCALA 1050]MBW4591071.1 S-layer family protein [Aetokthonos hydrillicola CCALA 1050]MDR9899462.1 S-layer family protein [Aetokthonos hydrillicola Thurmond2011]